MNAMIGKGGRVLASAAIILACVIFIAKIDGIAGSRKRLPAKNIQPIMHVATQSDVYRVYRNAGLRGAHVVQVGPHFHLKPFFPHEKAISAPFPLTTFDVRLQYEQGVDSYTWLFIANKNGLVRKVTSLLPDDDFREKIAALESDFSFRRYRNGYQGYSYDLPRKIFPISDFSCPDEPVVVNVDAGIFTGSMRPKILYASLQQRCPDVRLFVLVDSVDNDSITKRMRRDLGMFKELLEHKRT